MSTPWKKSYDKPRQCIAKQKHLFADRGPFSQNYNFSSSHVWMWELNHKEVWGLMNWCFQIVVLGKTLESPLDSKEIKPVNPRGNQSWIFIGRTDAEAKAPILWPPDKLWKRPWCWESREQAQKWVTENEIVGWHHWLNGLEFEQALWVGDGQGSLACCSPWVTKSQTQLSGWTELNWTYICAFNLLIVPWGG